MKEPIDGSSTDCVEVCGVALTMISTNVMMEILQMVMDALLLVLWSLAGLAAVVLLFQLILALTLKTQHLLFH